MKLSAKQKDVLTQLVDGAASAYTMKCSLSTLDALAFRGLVRRVAGAGSMAFPRNTDWYITQAGRSVLEEKGDE